MTRFRHFLTLMAQIYTTFLKLEEVIERVKLSKKQIYRLINAGQFPSQINISPRRVAWVASEIEEWCVMKIDESRL